MLASKGMQQLCLRQPPCLKQTNMKMFLPAQSSLQRKQSPSLGKMAAVANIVVGRDQWIWQFVQRWLRSKTTCTSIEVTNVPFARTGPNPLVSVRLTRREKRPNHTSALTFSGDSTRSLIGSMPLDLVTRKGLMVRQSRQKTR